MSKRKSCESAAHEHTQHVLAHESLRGHRQINSQSHCRQHSILLHVSCCIFETKTMSEKRQATDYQFTVDLVYHFGPKEDYVVQHVDFTKGPAAMLSFGREWELDRLMNRQERTINKMNAGSWVLSEPSYSYQPENIPGNILRPLDAKSPKGAVYFKYLAENGGRAMSQSFWEIKLATVSDDGAIQAVDEDYGGANATLGGGSRFIFGYPRNIHNDKTQKNKNDRTVARWCGLLGLETGNGTINHWKNIIQSLSNVVLPLMILRMRVDCMVGNKTRAHVDSCRGCSPNGVMFHSPGGMLMLSRYVEYKTSVVHYRGEYCPDGDYFIPFDLNAVGDEIILIGRDPLDDARVVWYVGRASIAKDLQPVGRLKYVVMGIRKGCVLTVPFSDAVFRPEAYRTNKRLEELPFIGLVKQAHNKRFRYSDEYLREEKMKVYALGTVPHVWYWFWGWRHMHWIEGNEMAARTHIFMGLCNENVSGANRPGKNAHFVNWK